MRIARARGEEGGEGRREPGGEGDVSSEARRAEGGRGINDRRAGRRRRAELAGAFVRAGTTSGRKGWSGAKTP